MHNNKGKEQLKATPISAEEYLRNDRSNANQPQTDHKFNELVDHITQLQKNEHSNVIETEGKDKMADVQTIQPPRQMNVEHGETIRQKGNRIKDV